MQGDEPLSGELPFMAMKPDAQRRGTEMTLCRATSCWLHCVAFAQSDICSVWSNENQQRSAQTRRELECEQ